MCAASLYTSPFGHPLPNRDHAVVASMPTWDAYQALRNGDMAVIQKLQTGYPRYFIHASVQKVSKSNTTVNYALNVGNLVLDSKFVCL